MSEQSMRHFTATYREDHDGVVTHGHGVVWPDGQVALHWRANATLLFKSVAELRKAYQDSPFTMTFIDEQEAARG